MKQEQKDKATKGEVVFSSFTALSSWIFVGIFLVIPIFSTIVFSIVNLTSSNSMEITSGVYDISTQNLETHGHVELSGSWLYFPDVYYTEDTLPLLLGDESYEAEYVSLPMTDFAQSRGTATLQALVKFNNGDNLLNPIVLGIEFLQEDVSVYYNGRKLEPYTPQDSSLGSLSSSCYFNLSTGYDSTREYQELSISINDEESDTDLYNRVLYISTYANGLYQEKTLQLLEVLFAGMAYCLMMIGFIYMIIRPQRSTLTLINLFDIVLIVFVIYAHTNISPFLGLVLPFMALGDVVVRGAALFFLCMSIPLGNDLVDSLFVAEKKMPPIFTHPLNSCFITLSVLFSINPFLSSGILYYVLLALGTVLVWSIFWRIRLLEKERKLSFYEKFQTVKTCYIVGVIAVDLLTMHSTEQNSYILLACYCLFFIVHLFVRAYEYSLPEKRIAEINRNLEATVAERTEKLTRANEFLQELSSKDALTKAYNRMYFEDALLKALEEYHHHQAEEPLRIHLCIFDLDNFKQINDHFGHSVGDEQLVETIELAKKVMPEDVLISRIGGEEFTFLFREKEEEEVLQLVEQVRCGLEKRAEEQEGRTTGSFGVTAATVFCDRKTFFIQADECLYYSKQHGKNCITHDFTGELTIARKTT